MHSGRTFKVGIIAKTKNVEGIIPINIFFMNLLDFYSSWIFTCFITQSTQNKRKREPSFQNPFLLYLSIPHPFRKLILLLKPLQSSPFLKTIEEQLRKIITFTTNAFRKGSTHLKTLKRNNLQ